MQITLPDYVKKCINTIENAGYEAFCVGGAVRDSISVLAVPSDFDIAVNCPPDVTLSLFERAIPTGIEHGTVTVIIDQKPIEVTTYRIDGDYSDARHPNSVSFVGNIKEDLARRDFTVNAIAYNEKNGIFDPFCGCEDIKSKILRTVGDPAKRFCEDSLRIMRLFRFASQLGFCIEENTLKCAIENIPLLKNISAERIFSELVKMLNGEFLCLTAPFFSSGGLKNHGITPCDIEKISALPRDAVLRFAALCIIADCDAENTCRLLKTDNEFRNSISAIIRLYEGDTPTSRADIKHGLAECDSKDYFRFLTLLSLKGINTDSLIKECQDILSKDEPYLIKHLLLDGNDLLSMEIAGKEIGNALRFLQNEVIENKEQNTKENLKNLITKRFFRS